MECSCTVNTDIDSCESVELEEVYNSIALTQEKCNECHRVICTGEHYVREYFTSPDYDDSTLHKTCDDCYSLRQVFFSSGWYYGMLWESMQEFINECGGDISVTCVLQLTKDARDMVLDLVEEEWGDVDICPICEHLVIGVWAGGFKCTNKKCDYSEPCL